MLWIHALIQCHVVTHSYFEVDALCEGSRAECHGSMHSYMYFEVDALCEGSRAECMHSYMKLHEISVNKTRQIKATMPEDNSFFSREKKELPQAGFKPATSCILGRCSTS